MRASSSMNGRISSGPSAQFRPTLSGRRATTEFQNASTVCPVSVRPLRSVIVPGDHERQIAPPARPSTSFDGEDRRLGS